MSGCQIGLIKVEIATVNPKATTQLALPRAPSKVTHSAELRAFEEQNKVAKRLIARLTYINAVCNQG